MADFYRLENNVYTYLNENISDSDITIRVKKSLNPFNDPIIPASNETGVLTLIDNHEDPTKIEIINFTSFTDNGDGTLSVTGIQRGKENTALQSFVKGSIVTQSLTREAVNSIIINIKNLKLDWEASAAYDISVSDIDNWNEAFSWGDHSTFGYLTNITSEVIGDLNNVDLSGLSDGNILKYNSTTGNFEVNEYINWTIDQNGNKYIHKNNINIVDGGNF